MSDRQIQTVNNRDYSLARRTRPRGLFGQVGMALLEPGVFFRSFPLEADGRGWLWVGLLVLALVSISAVRQSELSQPAGGGLVPAPAVSLDPGFDLGPIPGGLPPGAPPAGALGAGGPSPEAVTATWTTALRAGANIIVGWAILAVLLAEVSLFNGTLPRLGRNFRLAVWTSLPIGLMAGLQLVYFAAGGLVGKPGLSGLLDEWAAYATLPAFSRSLALSIAIHLTLFWFWSLVLVYAAGRGALRGKRWAVLLVVAAWVIISVLAPVLTGAIKAPEAVPALDLDAGPIPDFAAPPEFQLNTDSFAPPLEPEALPDEPAPFDLLESPPVETDEAAAGERIPEVTPGDGS